MVKVIAVVYKRPDMEWAEFRRYWKEVHGPIAAKMPGLRKYVQDHILDPAQKNRPFDGLAELWFDSPEAFQAAMASPEWQATLADVPEFLDADRDVVVAVDEVQVV